MVALVENSKIAGMTDQFLTYRKVMGKENILWKFELDHIIFFWLAKVLEF